MTDSNVRELLDEKHADDRERRIEGIKRWVDYIRSEPPETWGPQQNSIVNDQLAAAQNVQMSAAHRQQVSDLAAEILAARDDEEPSP